MRKSHKCDNHSTIPHMSPTITLAHVRHLPVGRRPPHFAATFSGGHVKPVLTITPSLRSQDTYSATIALALFWVDDKGHMCFYCKIESVNNESGVAWYSPVLCSRQRTGHCSRHEKTELSPEHKGQGNDWTCEETLEVSSRSTNQDAMLWGELLQAVLIRPHRSSWPRGPTTPDVQ